jgi:hypothetical protein
MLALYFDLELGPGRGPDPMFHGGALHGFFEGAVLHHAPHLLAVLRPQGADGLARFALEVPAHEQPPGDSLQFGAILYGNARDAWRQIARAVLAQCRAGYNGRRVRLAECSMEYPGDPLTPILLDARLLELDSPLGDAAPLDRRDWHTPMPTMPPRLYALGFDVPLLLASRKAQRNRLPRDGELPWPSLDRVLESLAHRLRELEPELARTLGLAADWQPSPLACELAPLTFAAAPARQVETTYRSTPRKVDKAETPFGKDARRSFDVPGIVGELVYPATGDPLEFALLYWGQWLRVGQKTTMGYGAYRLSVL